MGFADRRDRKPVAFASEHEAVELGATLQFAQRDHAWKPTHELDVGHVPRRIRGITLGVVVLVGRIERGVVGVRLAGDLGDTDNPGLGDTRVVEQDAITLALRPKVVASLVVAHSVPTRRADACEIVDAEGLRFALHRPVLLWCHRARITPRRASWPRSPRWCCRSWSGFAATPRR